MGGTKAAKIIHNLLRHRIAEELLLPALSNSSSAFTLIFMSTIIRRPAREEADFSSKTLIAREEFLMHTGRHAVTSEISFVKFNMSLYDIFSSRKNFHSALFSSQDLSFFVFFVLSCCFCVQLF